MTFLNLLDSYLPLVLSIYSITFRRNNFPEYFNAMKYVWLMFYCFRRHHYDKAPLIWLSNILYWKQNNQPLFDNFVSFLNTTDEYGVENAHSIIRSQTNDGDSSMLLERKAKAIFQSKHTQHSFRSHFTPPKNHIFSSNQLREMKFLAASVITDVFSRISELKIEMELGESSLDKMLKAYLPENCSVNVYPLGYHTSSKPDPARRCDMPGCFYLQDALEWTISEGCSHSFHLICLQESTHCPICRVHLKKVIKKLATTAKDAFVDGGQKKGKKNKRR